jgi:hypothetical protein
MTCVTYLVSSMYSNHDQTLSMTSAEKTTSYLRRLRRAPGPQRGRWSTALRAAPNPRHPQPASLVGRHQAGRSCFFAVAPGVPATVSFYEASRTSHFKMLALEPAGINRRTTVLWGSANYRQHHLHVDPSLNMDLWAEFHCDQNTFLERYWNVIIDPQ